MTIWSKVSAMPTEPIEGVAWRRRTRRGAASSVGRIALLFGLPASLLRLVRRAPALIPRLAGRHLDPGHRLDHEEEEGAGDGEQGEGAEDLADAGGADDEAEEGAEEDDDEDQLEAEDRPVAGVPHPPDHHPHDHRLGDDLRNSRLFAVDLDAGGVADDDREGDQAGDDRADGDDGRALALGQRLQGLTGFAVALLGLGVAGGHPLAAALLALDLLVSHRTPQPPGATPLPPAAKAARSALAAAAGSPASRIARTAQRRSAPASTTCSAFSASMPPIAKKG